MNQPNHDANKVVTPFIRNVAGWTIIELMIVTAIIAILSGVSISQYKNYKERIRVSQAIVDIAVASTLIGQYYVKHGDYPSDLSEVAGGRVDPWGRDYVYVNLTAFQGKGKARKDRKLNPLNSDFDLYSVGKDGATKIQISNRDSLDDVLRANDGAFIDLASKF